MAIKEQATMFLFALLAAIQAVHAQGSLNLTVTFYPDTSDSCNSTSDGITFTTSGVPVNDECFTIDELFSGNTTFGFRNQTPSTAISQDSRGLHWRIENLDAYNSKANYSHILYQQPAIDGSDDEGVDASRYLAIYNDEDCKATGQPIQPWIGWTCSSSAAGDCETTPYSVASFRIADAEELNERDGKCWSFAFEGAAARSIGGFSGGLVAIVSLASVFFLLA